MDQINEKIRVLEGRIVRLLEIVGQENLAGAAERNARTSTSTFDGLPLLKGVPPLPPPEGMESLLRERAEILQRVRHLKAKIEEVLG